MLNILAIDPGYEQSAWVLYDGYAIGAHAIESNETLLDRFGRFVGVVDAVVLEQIESFGMAVGREVFETVFWTGRFFEAARQVCVPDRLPRKAVKLHLCQSARATDSNIRVALVDRFGGTVQAIGSKKAPGRLYGIKSHEWAALAVAVTYSDQQQQRKAG
jgi:hypothetical protein